MRVRDASQVREALLSCVAETAAGLETVAVYTDDWAETTQLGFPADFGTAGDNGLTQVCRSWARASIGWAVPAAASPR